MESQALKALALEAAHDAGAMLKENFGGNHAFQEKTSYADLVTEFDHRSEEIIVKKIQKRFPDHDILTEEGRTRVENSPYRWIIDPVDGTTNYAHGFPIFCVAIGLEHQSELQLGVVYLPTLNELFVAERGQGAWLNSERIRVSTIDRLAQGLLIGSSPHDRNLLELNLKLFDRFVRASHNVLRVGSAAAALCYLAAGRVDGYWGLVLQPWDLAAASLILREAGGVATNFKNEPINIYGREIAASNGKIHGEMLKILNDAMNT
ncbi:inositol monophosphatase [Candidatus Acetothermia bacterium]|nr:inositol monophosphatase [Candidatus Acetothermia bacterium]MBI3659220.1 inositol monophosphatase [Candidatus Acetothermia bacterium]